MTSFDRLWSLPQAARYLKPGESLAALAHSARQMRLRSASAPPAASFSKPSTVGPRPPPDLHLAGPRNDEVLGAGRAGERLSPVAAGSVPRPGRCGR